VHYDCAPVPDVFIAADSMRSPEMRHEVPVAIPDPFYYMEHAGRRFVVVGSFEVPRVEELGLGHEVHAPEHFGLDELYESGLKYWEIGQHIGLRACKELGISSAVVPHTFPLELADFLRANGVEVRPDRQFFVARRRSKTDVELAGIRRAQRACEAAMDAVRELLRRASAARNGSTLKLDGEPLTCERLKAAIGHVFTELGVFADESIVSHGPQTAIGHDMGSGAIERGEPIILDLFPRDRETACYADMTRTFVVGEPSTELAEYHRVVKEALDRSTTAIKAGVSGRDVNRLACEHFQEHGYPTLLSKEPGEVLFDGFYHGLGHGVGLEVHEQPILGRIGEELVVGDVVTVEPGLYRPGFGGCRLEDLVLVTQDGSETLTQYPYDLEP
jgi:Xaa-Pro aminopeptidase